MGEFETGQGYDLDFSFTISGGQVTAMQAVAGSHSHDLKLPNNATFAVGSGTVTETLSGTASTTVVTYGQEAGSTTLYDTSEIKTTITSPTTTDGAYSFTISSGAVTAEKRVETENGQTETHTVHMPLDAVFTVGTGMVSEQVVRGHEVDTITYAQPSGSTLYALASSDKVFIDPGSATTALDVDPSNRMEFSIDGSGTVTAAQRLDFDGGLHAITASGVTFTQLAAGYVEEVITHGSHTSFVVYAEGQGTNGIYTAIAHGDGSSVDLAGLQAQVSQAEALLTSTTTSSTGWVI
jgi:hypothetical protein